MYSNFRDVWFDNTTPGLNGCSFNSFAGQDPINRLVLSPDYLARKPHPLCPPKLAPRPLLASLYPFFPPRRFYWSWASSKLFQCLDSKSLYVVNRREQGGSHFSYFFYCALYANYEFGCVFMGTQGDTRRVSQRTFLIVQWNDKFRIANMEKAIYMKRFYD